ncbi:MAG: FixH family protein [Pseudomonadota bacterium]
MTKRFTGWHMTGIMVAFFGVVIAVNFLMASYAVETFGGTVVENSYVASQRYNAWLAEARAQRKLGWSVDVAAGGDRLVRITPRAPAGLLTGASITATAAHPLGRLPERDLVFRNSGAGQFVASQTLPAGRWLLRIEVRDGGHDARFDDEVHL